MACYLSSNHKWADQSSSHLNTCNDVTNYDILLPEDLLIDIYKGQEIKDSWIS